MYIDGDIFMQRCFERIARGEASRFDTCLLLGCLLEDEQVRKELVLRDVDVDRLVEATSSMIEQRAKAVIDRPAVPEITDEFKDVYAKAMRNAKISGTASPTQMDVLHVMVSDESLSVNRLIHEYRSPSGTNTSSF